MNLKMTLLWLAASVAAIAFMALMTITLWVLFLTIGWYVVPLYIAYCWFVKKVVWPDGDSKS